ncbi:hypothetical protein [Thermostichus sp. MS-CIW-37]|jgi:hypothetical protein
MPTTSNSTPTPINGSDSLGCTVDILPCPKAGDSGSWFCDSTYRIGLPLYGSGARLPRRFPKRYARAGIQGGSLLPKGTVAKNNYKAY